MARPLPRSVDTVIIGARPPRNTLRERRKNQWLINQQAMAPLPSPSPTFYMAISRTMSAIITMSFSTRN